MDYFAKIFNGLKLLTIFEKCFILDARQNFQYALALCFVDSTASGLQKWRISYYTRKHNLVVFNLFFPNAPFLYP